LSWAVGGAAPELSTWNPLSCATVSRSGSPATVDEQKLGKSVL